MEGYIREDSYLEYESDVYKVVYKGLGTSPDFELKSTRWSKKLLLDAYPPVMHSTQTIGIRIFTGIFKIYGANLLLNKPISNITIFAKTSIHSKKATRS